LEVLEGNKEVSLIEKYLLKALNWLWEKISNKKELEIKDKEIEKLRRRIRKLEKSIK
jgi:hypothetical protein